MSGIQLSLLLNDPEFPCDQDPGVLPIALTIRSLVDAEAIDSQNTIAAYRLPSSRRKALDLLETFSCGWRTSAATYHRPVHMDRKLHLAGVERKCICISCNSISSQKPSPRHSGKLSAPVPAQRECPSGIRHPLRPGSTSRWPGSPLSPPEARDTEFSVT